MAILDKFEVCITVGGQPLQEYPEPDHRATTAEGSSNKVSNYIEAKPGTVFGISTRLLPGYNFRCQGLTRDVMIDGRKGQLSLIERSEYNSRSGGDGFDDRIWIFQGNKAWESHEFQFADLKTRESAPEDNDNDLKAIYGGLGTITVTFYRLKKCRSSEASSYSMAWEDVSVPVPEKAVKGEAVSLCAKLHKKLESSTESSNLEQYGSNLAVFTFKYRTREALKDLMIIPRTPRNTPHLNSLEGNLSALSEDETGVLRGLLQKITQRGASTQIKDEDGDSHARKRPAPEHAIAARRYKTRRLSDGKECIDLASNGDD